MYHYAERHYTECQSDCHYDDYIYAQCHFADCHYADCHYEEYLYAQLSIVIVLNVVAPLPNVLLCL